MSVDVNTRASLEQIAESVQAGRCILFLGSMVHAPPPAAAPFTYPEEQRPPSAKSLARTLAAGCDLEERFPGEDATNLQRVALAYELTNSRGRLVQEIRGVVHTGKRPSPVLTALAELNFPQIITTNYDQLAEDALRAAGKKPQVSVYSPSLQPVDYPDWPSTDNPVVFKIHGDIDRPESLVVTDEDYIQFLLRMSHKDQYDPVPLELKAALKKSTTLFVGYSLLDYNLRVLFRALRWGLDPARWPDMFSVDYEPDQLIQRTWQDRQGYVRFVVQDVWSFVPQLYRLVTGKEMGDHPA